MNSNQTEQFICESVFWVKVIDSTTHSQWYNESSSQARICLPVMFESKRAKNGWVITSSELKCLRNWRVETAPKILKLNSDWKEQLHRIEPITTSIFHWNQFDTQSNSFPVMSMNFLQVSSKTIWPQRFRQYKENHSQVTKLIQCTEPETQTYGKIFNLVFILFQLVQTFFRFFSL